MTLWDNGGTKLQRMFIGAERLFVTMAERLPCVCGDISSCRFCSLEQRASWGDGLLLVLADGRNFENLSVLNSNRLA
jgi:hypothetical protein